MRTPLLSVAAVMLLVACPTAATAREPTENIDAYIAERMDAVGVPGAAVSVIEGEKVTHSQQFGHTPDGEAITALVLFGASLFPSRRTGRARAIVWGASAIVIPLALLIGIPLTSDIGLRFLWLFTPDLALGLTAVSAGAFALGAHRTVSTLRQRTGANRTAAHTHEDTELTSARYSGRLRT